MRSKPTVARVALVVCILAVQLWWLWSLGLYVWWVYQTTPEATESTQVDPSRSPACLPDIPGVRCPVSVHAEPTLPPAWDLAPGVFRVVHYGYGSYGVSGRLPRGVRPEAAVLEITALRTGRTLVERPFRTEMVASPFDPSRPAWLALKGVIVDRGGDPDWPMIPAVFAIVVPQKTGARRVLWTEKYWVRPDTILIGPEGL